MTDNFAILGAAGYVAPRHLRAIHDTGNRLIAACDTSDSVGVLDRHFPEAAFFTEVEEFERFLGKGMRRLDKYRLHYLTVCTPNHLHVAHALLGLRLGADVVCEKPLVLDPQHLDELADAERLTGGRINTILQLRLLPSIIALRKRIIAAGQRKKYEVKLTYITRRGPWYQKSWKGDPRKSGGLVTNIGIHLFDLLLWLFGPVESSLRYAHDPDVWSGALELRGANVQWTLSTDADLLPEGTGPAFRSITVDGEEVEFSAGFTDLHTQAYARILLGEGFGLEEARPAIELVDRIRSAYA